MSYKKVFPKTSLKKVDVLAAEGGINIGCYNVDGKLIPAINSANKIGDLQWQVQSAWYAANTKKYIATTGQYLLISDDTMTAAVRLALNTPAPSMMESCYVGSHAAIVAGKSIYCAIYAQNVMRPLRVAAHGFVLKNGRNFGIDDENPLKIHWSGENGMDTWTSSISGAGWTLVQNGYGEILNLVVYKDKIVAVREYGLTFLTAYGNPENYKLSYLEQKLPKICKDTAAVVGANLVFYTEDGLYFYDGNKVEKSNLTLAEEMQNPKVASCKDGKYFLCGISKTLERGAILVYDSVLNSAYLIDFPADVIAAGEKVLAYSGFSEYRLETGGEYAFTSGEIDFSSNGVKVLKEVILKGVKDAEIEVSNGVISRIVGGVRGKFRPNMRGKSFKITVYGSKKINGISAVAEVTDGV